MRLLLAFALLSMLAACHGPSPIQTSVSGPMRGEVEQDILETQRMHHPDCPVGRIVAARIVENGAGATQELWTLEGCGRTYAYDVTITHEGLGGQVSVHERDAD